MRPLKLPAAEVDQVCCSSCSKGNVFSRQHSQWCSVQCGVDLSRISAVVKTEGLVLIWCRLWSVQMKVDKKNLWWFFFFWLKEVVVFFLYYIVCCLFYLPKHWKLYYCFDFVHGGIMEEDLFQMFYSTKPLKCILFVFVLVLFQFYSETTPSSQNHCQ